ncbi:hypothetical protein DLJ82_5751 (plasmid) [Rhizobium leguminosarum]|uniref:DNA polymerase Y-family little finger domain-containing protein n=1 Tax=Rhizobium leguminosarum TaxID=384 RepID=A0A2Z4YSC4_RHILE|nr:hypothetical protein DLJ82_5751 [Rhizobium leguminosarum]
MAELKPLAEKVWRYCETQDISGKTMTAKIKYSAVTRREARTTATTLCQSGMLMRLSRA